MHLYPSEEVDLERKVKYLPNLMKDISEKKMTISYIKCFW